MTATNRQKQIVLARHLIAIGSDMIGSRSTTLSRAAIDEFRAEVATESAALIADDTPRLIRVEAVCLVAMLAELTYVRADKDRAREERLQAIIAQLVICLQADVNVAVDQARRGLS